MYTAITRKRAKSSGIMTLQASSMPFAMPKHIITALTATATIIHQALPTPKTPFAVTRPTASPRVSAVGAAASKAEPIAAMSWPRAKSSPLMLILVYLNIQPMTTL